ncbi:hypothetical protein [Prochlorococcus sp. MIT 1341]|uniref:hypothetical protein n=1 Tax=Prochlorococcus sp. MIT 1341 TaxID=3096221 RepID=UPI002A75A02F|nr:hypothetical protein [Prochlorococcus sp. MIT 1341]
MRCILFACFIAATLFLTPVVTFAYTADLSPAVSDVTKKFSEKFCTSIGKGMTPEKAGESAVAQLAPQLTKGFFFSPVMDEIMSAPKADLADSVSNNILDKCGNELGGITTEELDDYLTLLASKIPVKSKGLNLPSVRQKAPLRQ